MPKDLRQPLILQLVPFHQILDHSVDHLGVQPCLAADAGGIVDHDHRQHYSHGKREFGKRAVAMNAQSLGKVAGVYILALMGFGLQGAVSGYVISYGLALAVAYAYSRERGQRASAFPASDLISFAIPVVIFSILLSLLMNLDIFFVRGLLKDAEAAGFYTSALALTRAPYFVFYAFAITLLPIISRLTSSDRFDEASRYVNKSLR